MFIGENSHIRSLENVLRKQKNMESTIQTISISKGSSDRGNVAFKPSHDLPKSIMKDLSELCKTAGKIINYYYLSDPYIKNLLAYLLHVTHIKR